MPLSGQLWPIVKTPPASISELKILELFQPNSIFWSKVPILDAFLDFRTPAHFPLHKSHFTVQNMKSKMQDMNVNETFETLNVIYVKVDFTFLDE